MLSDAGRAINPEVTQRQGRSEPERSERPTRFQPVQAWPDVITRLLMGGAASYDWGGAGGGPGRGAARGSGPGSPSPCRTVGAPASSGRAGAASRPSPPPQRPPGGG